MDAEFYRGLLDSLAEGVYFVDRDRCVKYWNRAAERLSGYAAQEVLGNRGADKILQHMVMLGGSLCIQEYPLAATMEDGQVREAELYLLHKYGYRIPVVVRATPVRDSSGAIVGAAEVFRSNVKDMNVLEELEALHKDSFTDQLTGVGNRHFADMTFKTLEMSSSGYGVPFGVLMVEVDGFSARSEAWGQDVSGQVLRMVAQTLAKTLRSLDVICRWNGTDFVLLVAIANEQMLLGMAKRQRLLVETSSLDRGGEGITVTASLGGAVSRQGETAAEVVARATAQLRRSQAAGGNLALIDLTL
ncbi:MAG: diguanylate cyclase [Proteobacteria bacterium]|nr:diguanylate cyclase [Pseudomonadota bacterium]MBU1595039.1 diguanylate cyclase [Pseudomonadota bacterium]